MTILNELSVRTALTAGTEYQIKGTGIFHFSSAVSVTVATADVEGGTYTNDFTVDSGAAKQIFLRENMWIKPDAACYVQRIAEY